MSKKKIVCNNKNISKTNFIKTKSYLIQITLVLIKNNHQESYGTKISLKYFIEYNEEDVIGPLYIKLPQINGYVKCFDSNKTMSFKVIDNKLFKQYANIWGKVSNLMNIEFDSEPVYGDYDKYLKTRINIYGDKVNTNFRGNKVPKENTSYKCLSLKMLDSVIRVNKKYYPETLLEECKYEIKKNKMENLINDYLEQSSSDSDSGNENDNESNNESNE